ncbi:hypothetical protein A2U01_0088145, partial [Trifolium medium]|nr:hypothetical protein [Trifolium medium]
PLFADEMESIADRMLKAKQNERASRGKKKVVARTSQHVRPGTTSVQVISTHGGDSGTPSSSVGSPPAKRMRDGDPLLTETGMG